MLQITYRHMTSSESLRIVAEEKFERVQAHFQEPVRCHLVVDCCTGHARKGDKFEAHVTLALVTGDLHVEATGSHEQAATAVRRAFEHVERQLASRNGRQHAAEVIADGLEG